MLYFCRLKKDPRGDRMEKLCQHKPSTKAEKNFVYEVCSRCGEILEVAYISDITEAKDNDDVHLV